jgi:hypothetical protein
MQIRHNFAVIANKARTEIAHGLTTCFSTGSLINTRQLQLTATAKIHVHQQQQPLLL